MTAAEQLGYPCVVKIASVNLPHKTELGALRLGLEDRESVGRAYDEMLFRVRALKPEASIEGVLVQKQVKGVECLLGISRDEQLGPTLVMGLGGVFVEILADIMLRIPPISAAEARRAVERIMADTTGGHALALNLCISYSARAEIARVAADLERIADAEFDFHREVNRIAGSPKLAWFLNNAARVIPYRLYARDTGWGTKAVTAHTKLIEAMRVRDHNEVITQTLVQFDDAAERLVEHRRRVVTDRPGV